MPRGAFKRIRPDRAPTPTYDDLVRRLDDLVALCRRWRVYGAELTHAEHAVNRAKIAKPPKVYQIPKQGRLI